MASPPHYWLSNTGMALSPIAEPAYSVSTYTADLLTKYEIYKEVGLTTLLLEVTYTYSSNDLDTETVKVYDDGSLIDTKVYNYTYTVTDAGPPIVRTVKRLLA